MLWLIISEGAAIPIASLWFYVKGRKRRPPKPKEPSPPNCSCGHWLSSHDPKTGKCHSAVKVETAWEIIKIDDYYGKSAKSIPSAWEYRPCPCHQYVGPKPIDEFFANEIAWGSSKMKAGEE